MFGPENRRLHRRRSRVRGVVADDRHIALGESGLREDRRAERRESENEDLLHRNLSKGLRPFPVRKPVLALRDA